jgi:hypothetical protein
LGPAAPRSAITRTDLTDLTRLSLQPSVDVAGPGGWVCRRLGWAGQAARAGAGSGSGMGGCGRDEGAPGQLAGVWAPWLGWLVGPLSQ